MVQLDVFNTTARGWSAICPLKISDIIASCGNANPFTEMHTLMRRIVVQEGLEVVQLSKKS